MRNLITDVPGIAIGNAEDAAVMTGVTVVLPDARSVCAVDSRGGGPGTRETDALDPSCLVDAVDAVVLSGGSVYGLDAASGVTAWLGAQGRGYRIVDGIPPSPIVPAAILFDLANGGAKDWAEAPPYADLGKMACETACRECALGNAGAGFGAVAGALKGGLGSASAVTPGGFTVGALVAVNSFGSAVIPGTEAFWAAPYEQNAEFGGVPVGNAHVGVSADDIWGETKRADGPDTLGKPGANTTVGVVATDAALTPADARRLAVMAQDGLARAVRPVHTPFDGDTVFVLATAGKDLPEPKPLALAELGAVAADTMARAIARGVYEAESIGAHVSYRDRRGG